VWRTRISIQRDLENSGSLSRIRVFRSVLDIVSALWRCTEESKNVCDYKDSPRISLPAQRLWDHDCSEISQPFQDQISGFDGPKAKTYGTQEIKLLNGRNDLGKIWENFDTEIAGHRENGVSQITCLSSPWTGYLGKHGSIFSGNAL
jgi:hypothetical protein